MLKKILNRKFSVAFLSATFFLNVVFAQDISKSITASNNQINAVQSTIEEKEAILGQAVRGARAIAPSPQIAMASEDYLVTAGDVYTLYFAAGTTPISYTLTVDASYKIRVANLAVLNVYGKTFIEVKKQVEEIVSKNYPMSGVQFVLVTPSIFTVTLTGEVKETTVTEAWALARVSSIVSNSLTDFSSTRDIKITGADGETKTYDLFKAVREGDLTQDPYVKPGDVIEIQRYKRRVRISGQVERPGTYQLLEGENLKDLIVYYGGGITDKADLSRIQLYRYYPDKLSTETVYLNERNILKDMVLCHRDSISITSCDDLTPVMFMEGALKGSTTDTDETSSNQKVSLHFSTGMNYGFFIRDHANLFTSVSDLEKAYIIRGDKIIPININEILYDNKVYTEENIEPYDTLMVPFRQFFISVSGAVANPGRYPYIPDRSWDYYIGLAGGFTENNAGDAIIITDINGNKLSKKQTITPEATIEAKKNSFLYKFNIYAPVITTTLSIITATLTAYSISQR